MAHFEVFADWIIRILFDKRLLEIRPVALSWIRKYLFVL